MKKLSKLFFIAVMLIVVIGLWRPADSQAFVGRVIAVPQIHEMLVTSGKEMYMVVLNEVCPWTDFTVLAYSPDAFGHGKWWVEKWISGKNVRVDITKQKGNIEKTFEGKKIKIPVVEANVYLHSGCNNEEWSMHYYKRGLSVNKNILHHAKNQVGNDHGFEAWDY